MRDDTYLHPTGMAPDTVDLVCLGETARTDYLQACLAKGTGYELADETWTLNRGLSLFRCDLAFVLDEIDSESRADPAYGKRITEFVEEGGQLITTVIPPEFAASAAHQAGTITPYPARLVRDTFGIADGEDPYWHNSVPMILAYAHAIGVRRVNVWGADYTLPDGRVLEDQRANAEYWIGRCRQAGMEVRVAMSSTLTNARQQAQGLWVYGLVSADVRDHHAFLAQGPAKLACPEEIAARFHAAFGATTTAEQMDHDNWVADENDGINKWPEVRCTERGHRWRRCTIGEGLETCLDCGTSRRTDEAGPSAPERAV